MQRAGAIEATANVRRQVFSLVLLLCLAVSGCGNYCFSGSLNGTASGITVSNSSCPLTKATGAVIVQMGVTSAPPTAFAAFPPPPASPSPSPGALPRESLGALSRALPSAFPYNVQHIFVTLRSIEAHPDMVADEDSPAWQELAPDLSAHPVQLDLLAPLTMTGDSRSLASPAGAIAPATISADEYRQLRLRLMPRNPSPDSPIPESNACGNVGWNCIVFADRSAQPLEFAPSESAGASVRPVGFVPAPMRSSGFDAAPEFRIPLEPGTGNVFRVLPGEVIQLSIEFDPASSVYFASNAAVRLVPVFRVVYRRSSPAPTAQ